MGYSVAIPLEHIATVETQRQGQMCGCCWQLCGDQHKGGCTTSFEDSYSIAWRQNILSYEIKLNCGECELRCTAHQAKYTHYEL